MMRHWLAPLVLVALAALLSAPLTGCTAIGFGVGAIVDSSVGKGSVDRLATVRPGTRVTMWLNDGRSLDGRYLGRRDSLSETPDSTRTAVNDGAAGSLREVILLGTDEGVRQVPSGEVRRVSVPVVSGKVIGLLTGLAVDSWWVYKALSGLSD